MIVIAAYMELHPENVWRVKQKATLKLLAASLPSACVHAKVVRQPRGEPLGGHIRCATPHSAKPRGL